MNRRHWRETVEILGIVSIVSALLLVAWEIHQANRIAETGLQLQLEQNLAQLHGERAMSPDFARLFPKLGLPEGHLITATEASQIKGLVAQMIEAYRSAQIAHDRGVLDNARLVAYSSNLARTIEAYPGLVPYLLAAHDVDPDVRKMRVFEPVRDLRDNSAP